MLVSHSRTKAKSGRGPGTKARTSSQITSLRGNGRMMINRMLSRVNLKTADEINGQLQENRHIS